MAWRRDPATGEWEMIDAATPDPMTQGMTGQESDPALRDAPPLPPSDEGYSNPDLTPIPNARVGATDGGYNNEDTDAQTAWVEAAKDRGNIVRFTPDGVFEIDPNTRQIIDQRPPMPRMN